MDYDPASRLPGEKVAIVSVGGTGSHILDYISKSPVGEIHLYDYDKFLTDNSRRSPGPFCDLDDCNPPMKADYFANRYRHSGPVIRGFATRIDEQNVNVLAQYTTVFLGVDNGTVRRLALEVCMSNDVRLINVGMGVFPTPDGALTGIAAVTACLGEFHGHADQCMTLNDSKTPRLSHQTIELNALNAALAVIKWKKLLGIYADYSRELDCQYSIAGNGIDNDYPQPAT